MATITTLLTGTEWHSTITYCAEFYFVSILLFILFTLNCLACYTDLNFVLYTLVRYYL